MSTNRRYAVAAGIAVALICGISIVVFSLIRQSEYDVTVLVPPGPFHGIHGSTFARDGSLYAGDIMGMSVHCIDVATGAARVIVGPPEGMADDVAIAPVGSPHAGTLVWSGVGVGRLYARAPKSETRLIADDLPGVNAVVFAPDGRLFVAQMGAHNNILWEFDLTDAKAGGRPPQKLWDETGGLNSFVVRDNAVIGPQGDTGAIIRFDLATHEVKTIATGLKWPTAVKADAKGQLYAVDLEAGTVHRIDVEKGTAPVIATLEPGLDNFSVGANGKLYVSSITRNGIFEIDPATGAERTVVRGHLTAPGGVAFAGSGETARVYVADMYTLRAVHPRTGAVETVIPMSREGIYPGAVSAHAGPNGDHLILTSWFVGRLEVRDRLSGNLVRTEKDLSAPRDALELDDGSLLVAETGAHRLLHIHADGSRSALPAAFADPVGLARAGEAVFVTDAWSGTLSRVDLRSGQASLVANGFGRPEGVAVRPDGKVLVVDSLKQTVVAVDPATGKQSVIATVVPVGLEGPPPQNPAWIHNGVAVAGDGMVYLSSDTRAALYAFRPRR